MNVAEFEKAKSIKMGRRLKGIYRKLVESGKWTPERFWETAQANNEMINRVGRSQPEATNAQLVQK